MDDTVVPNGVLSHKTCIHSLCHMNASQYLLPGIMCFHAMWFYLYSRIEITTHTLLSTRKEFSTSLSPKDTGSRNKQRFQLPSHLWEENTCMLLQTLAVLRLLVCILKHRKSLSCARIMCCHRPCRQLWRLSIIRCLVAFPIKKELLSPFITSHTIK